MKPRYLHRVSVMNAIDRYIYIYIFIDENDNYDKRIMIIAIYTSPLTKQSISYVSIDEDKERENEYGRKKTKTEKKHC